MVALNVDVRGPEVEATFTKMIDAGVAMTSTLPVYELSYPNRPTKDPRALEAMSPDVRAAYLADRERIDNDPNPRLTVDLLRNAMAYEVRFVEMGGLLAAGVDPTGRGWSVTRIWGPAGCRAPGRGRVHLLPGHPNRQPEWR